MTNTLKSKEVVLIDSIFVYPLDSLTIVPSSIQIKSNNNILPSELIYYSNGFQFKDERRRKSSIGDTLLVSYRVFPFDFSQSFKHIDVNRLKTKDDALYIGYDYNRIEPNNELIQESGIDYDGSFARGFSMGNNQSLLLNSNFNMQMAGDIGEGIRIKAAISDDNIPIQPEGNTRLLQEFDKVFIQVSRDKSHITAGDYELARPKSYFVNYFKQVQGLSVYNETQIKSNQLSKTRASFAISRAKFNRLELPVVEANQGPYKLPGGNGERFIIIEAGSEKIYEDGKLLTRGQNHDYIISYDRAEVVFTEKKLITKDSRIIAEYEYVDRNYLRSMYALESSYSWNKWELNFNYFNQQDSKNVTGDNNLDSIDINILTNSGDNLINARRSGIQLIDGEIDNSTITYKLEDSILIYSTNPDSALYIATFSEVEFGQGDYIIDTQVNANGRVYEYVGPGQGNYIAEIPLIAPQKNQIMSLGTSFKPTQNTLLETELSISNNDLNRFSAVNNNDNQGFAGYLRLEHKVYLDTAKSWTLKPYFALEATQKDFQALNPYRATEFTRDWNLQGIVDRENERLLKSGINLRKKEKVNFDYIFSNYERGLSYKGQKHDLNYLIQLKGFILSSRSSLLLSENSIEKTSFLRPILGIARNFGTKNPWQLGYEYEAEKNKKTVLSTDNLSPLSAAFNVNKIFLKSPQLNKVSAQVSYEHRIDEGIENDQFKGYSVADDLILNGKWHASKSSLLNVDFTYRTLDITNEDLALERNLNAKKSYLGQIDYKFNVLNGFMKSTSSFNIGSGQQAKIEYDYQEVQPGEGNYDWIDFNNDNIQQIGEFRISEFQDTSRFIQVPLYNNEFIQTNNSGINQSLRFDFNKLFTAPKASLETNDSIPAKKPTNKFWKTYLGRLNTISTIRIKKKVEIDESQYNPLNFSILDTNIVNYGAFINHTLFVNRGNPKWDLQIGNRANDSKIFQISGFESRGLEEYFTRLRLGIFKSVDFIVTASDGIRSGDSEAFDERDFNIAFRSILPELNYRPRQNLRFILKYESIRKNQEINLLESVKSNDFTMESSWRLANKSSWDTGFSFIQVDYVGETNSFISFELLEGLKPGNNYLWRTSFTKRLASNVDFIINYEGRKTGDNDPIHTGRAQVKATF